MNPNDSEIHTPPESWTEESEAPGMEPEAAPGAPGWITIAEQVIPAGQVVKLRLVQGQFSTLWAGSPTGQVRLQKWGELTPVPPPPPPPVPELVRFVGPASAQPGETITLEVGLSAPAPNGATVEVATPTFGIKLIAVMPGAAVGTGTLTIPAGQPEGTLILTADYRGFIRTHPVSIFKPTPPPVPVGVNVRDWGAKGDGVTVDQAAVQRAIDNCPAGGTVYFPNGNYLLEGTPRTSDHGLIEIVNRRDLTFQGESREGVRLVHGGRTGFRIVGSTSGLVIEKLSFQGRRAAGMAAGRSILCDGPCGGLTLRGLDFYMPAWSYCPGRPTGYDTGGSHWKVLMEDCAVYGWTSQGATLHGGETMRRCKFVQTPASGASTFSHGLYIANVDGVLVEDVTIEGSTGHSWQIYQDGAAARYQPPLGAWSRNITLRRVTEWNCFMGPIIAANGRYENLLVEDVLVERVRNAQAATFTISGTSYPIVNLVMRNINLMGGYDGVKLMGQIQGASIEGLMVKDHRCGVFVSNTAGIPNSFSNVAISGLRTENVPVPVGPLASGVVVR